MLRLVTSLFRTKRDSPSLPLGRWNTISIHEEENRDILVKNAIEKNAYWGNHDHCGSEICKTPVEFETIPKRYRQDVFRTLDSKAMRYDSIGHNLWHPYIRQIRNSGRGPLFQ